jgi:hypothetical protein
VPLCGSLLAAHVRVRTANSPRPRFQTLDLIMNPLHRYTSLSSSDFLIVIMIIQCHDVFCLQSCRDVKASRNTSVRWSLCEWGENASRHSSHCLTHSMVYWLLSIPSYLLLSPRESRTITLSDNKSAVHGVHLDSSSAMGESLKSYQQFSSTKRSKDRNIDVIELICM